MNKNYNKLLKNEKHNVTHNLPCPHFSVFGVEVILMELKPLCHIITSDEVSI